MTTHDMTGRVCLVTGASDGHGRAVAEALARVGAEVVLLGRNPQKCETAQREIAQATGRNPDVRSISRSDFRSYRPMKPTRC